MMKRITHLAIVLLMIAAIFDPADQLFHLKVPLFATVCGLALLGAAAISKGRTIPLGLLLYVFAVAFLLPLISICLYASRSHDLMKYEGFAYLKAYTFLLLALILSMMDLDILPALSGIFSVQAGLTVAMYAAAYNNPDLQSAFYFFGEKYGIFTVTQRSYGAFSTAGIYFQTAPLLVLSSAYLTFRCFHSMGYKRAMFLILLLVNITGQAVSGSRENMLMSVGVPLATWLCYSHRKAQLLSLVIPCFVLVVILSWGTLSAMLSPSESSNSIKIEHFNDYIRILSSPSTLLLGQGLGSFFDSTAYGPTAVTELTYLEVIREFGLVLGLPILALILCPLARLWDKRRRSERYLYIAFAAYLFVCLADPLLVSSSGMMILAIVAARAFTSPGRFQHQQSLGSLPGVMALS